MVNSFLKFGSSSELVLTVIQSATAAGERKAELPLTNYDKYIQEVLVNRGIHLVGWPFPSLVPFPTLPYDVGCLRVLLIALQNNTCYFQRLPPDEVMEFRRKYYQPVQLQLLEAPQERETTAFSEYVSTSFLSYGGRLISGCRDG